MFISSLFDRDDKQRVSAKPHLTCGLYNKGDYPSKYVWIREVAGLFYMQGNNTTGGVGTLCLEGYLDSDSEMHAWNGHQA